MLRARTLYAIMEVVSMYATPEVYYSINNPLRVCWYTHKHVVKTRWVCYGTGSPFRQVAVYYA